MIMPSSNDRGEVTRLLIASQDGDDAAFDRLFELVYEELRRVAHNRLQGERPNHTLNTTALVHETYLKLVDLNRIQYSGRAHFFAIAAHAMRNILVSYVHRRRAEKRGGGRPVESIDDVVVASEDYAARFLDLDDALRRLEDVDERTSRVVECRFFAALSIEETAEALGVSPATVKRDWTIARAWLNRALDDGPPTSDQDRRSDPT